MKQFFAVITVALFALCADSVFAQNADTNTESQSERTVESYVDAQIAEIKGLSDVQKTQALQTFALALGALLILVLALVATRRVVFYYNVADACWAMAIFLFPLIGIIVAKLLAPDGTPLEEIAFSGTAIRGELIIPHYFFMATLGCAILSAVITFAYSIRFNNLFVGPIVGILKIATGLLMLLTIFGIFSAATNKERKLAERAASVLLLSLLFAFSWRLLVNGEKVLARRQIRFA